MFLKKEYNFKLEIDQQALEIEQQALENKQQACEILKQTEINEKLENKILETKYHEMKEKNGYLYIGCTEIDKKKKIFKIGSTTNLQKRWEQYQTGHSEEWNYLKHIHVHNMASLEKLVLDELNPFKCFRGEKKNWFK